MTNVYVVHPGYRGAPKEIWLNWRSRSCIEIWDWNADDPVKFVALADRIARLSPTYSHEERSDILDHLKDLRIEGSPEHVFGRIFEMTHMLPGDIVIVEWRGRVLGIARALDELEIGLGYVGDDVFAYIRRYVEYLKAFDVDKAPRTTEFDQSIRGALEHRYAIHQVRQPAPEKMIGSLLAHSAFEDLRGSV